MWSVQNYDEQFARRYGFWRPYIEKVIHRYLDAACPVLDTGAICTTALPASDAKTAAMNTCLPSLASAATFAPPAIRSASWNSESGFAWMSSKRRPTAISFSASRRFCGVTFSEPVLDLIGESKASCRSQPLRMGISESFHAAGRAGKRTSPRSGHCRADLRRLPWIQSPLPHSRHGWLFLW